MDEQNLIPVDDLLPTGMVYLQGGRKYEYRSSVNCHTCQSPHRAEVERGLVIRHSVATILRQLPSGHGLSVAGVRRHVEGGHMGLNRTAHRVAIEQRAKELGQDPNEFEGLLGDEILLARAVVQRGIEQIEDGMAVTAGEALTAAKFMNDMTKGGSAEAAKGSAYFREAMRALMESVVAALEEIAKTTGVDPQRTMEGILKAAREDPVVAALILQEEQERLAMSR